MVVCCRRTLLRLVVAKFNNHKIDFSTLEVLSISPCGVFLLLCVYFSSVVTISVLVWFGIERSRRVEDVRGVGRASLSVLERESLSEIIRLSLYT